MLVYCKIVMNYFRGAMLRVVDWVACSLFSVPRARVAHSRHKVVPWHGAKVCTMKFTLSLNSNIY